MKHLWSGVLLLCALLLLAVFPGPAAAQQVFTTDISITRGHAVKISNIDDWDFGVYGALTVVDRALRLRDRACVYSSTGAYSLRITSLNGGTRLRLVTTDGAQLRYSIAVRYRDGNRFRNRRVRGSDETLAGLTGSLAVDCSDQGARDWNLQMRPIIGRNTFNRANPGIYTDLVTLLIVPE